MDKGFRRDEQDRDRGVEESDLGQREGAADGAVADAEVAPYFEDDPPTQVQEVVAEDSQVLELQRALAALNDRYLRLAAEFDTFRRRTRQEKEQMGVRAQATLAATLLDSLDDLSRVTSLDTGGADVQSFVDGVDLLTRKLMKALASAGLEPVNPLNERFDPAVHEAVTTQPAQSPEEDDSISSVFQPGYLFKGQLLRPARVAVRKWNG